MKWNHKLLSVYHAHRELLSYLFFGGLTTFVNIITYWLCERVFSFNTVTSTIIAWILSVLFAYLTNRIFVFHSKKNRFLSILMELSAFFAFRLFSGLVDLAVMYLFVDQLHFYDMAVKICSNVLVIVLNFIFSKLFIFKKKHESNHLSQS